MRRTVLFKFCWACSVFKIVWGVQSFKNLVGRAVFFKFRVACSVLKFGGACIIITVVKNVRLLCLISLQI